METTKYALVLTGTALPGFSADTVWPALAGYFRMEPAKLTDQVLVRAPLTIKESEDLGKLQTLQAGAASVGAEAEICAPDGRPGLFVLLEGTPRGPVPRVFVEERVGHGLWPDSVMVAEVGSNAWLPYRDFAPVFAGDATDASADVAMASGDGIASAAPLGYAASPATPVYAGDSVATGEVPAGLAIHAGFWRRSAAYVIDYFLTFVASYALGFVAGFVLVALQGAEGIGTAPLVGGLLGLIVGWLYFALQESSARQATLGKLAMGIKVTDGQGRRIGFGRATGRFFGKLLSGLILSIGFMMAGFTARKQALHDMLANTLVVFRAVEPGQPLPTVRPPMPWYGWVLNILLFGGIVLAILACFWFLQTLISGVASSTQGGTGF
jgi:uncharacterized RDD family membrane protein YckC